MSGLVVIKLGIMTLLMIITDQFIKDTVRKGQVYKF